MYKTVSAFELEFFSSLEFGFPDALYLQSRVGLVVNCNGEKNSNPKAETVVIEDKIFN